MWVATRQEVCRGRAGEHALGAVVTRKRWQVRWCALGSRDRWPINLCFSMSILEGMQELLSAHGRRRRRNAHRADIGDKRERAGPSCTALSAFLRAPDARRMEMDPANAAHTGTESRFSRVAYLAAGTSNAFSRFPYLAAGTESRFSRVAYLAAGTSSAFSRFPYLAAGTEKDFSHLPCGATGTASDFSRFAYPAPGTASAFSRFAHQTRAQL